MNLNFSFYMIHVTSPADIMMSQGVRTIVAVDVSAEDNNNLTDYGDHVSGWWLLLKRFFPIGPKVRVSSKR